MAARKSLAWFFYVAALVTSASTLAANDGATPPLGEYCPPGSTFDSMNCFFGKAPDQTTAFIFDGNFYHTPGSGAQPQCGPLTTFDQVNCFLRHVPAGYQAFIYENGWYVAPNGFFRSVGCPPGTVHDDVGCLRGTPPAGRSASMGLASPDQFGFERQNHENCQSLLAGSVPAPSPSLFCVAGFVPYGWTGFVQNNRWYIQPRIVWNPQTEIGPWQVQDNSPWAAPVCLADESILPSLKQWRLAWSDEFDTAPDNTPCYTTNDQALCMTQFDWSWSLCAGQPSGYSDDVRSSWTPAQAAHFGGLRNLNKCTWQVVDDYNIVDVNDGAPPVQNSYQPRNIRVEDGVLKMVTRFNPRTAPWYDCGRPLNTGENKYTKMCPFSGAMIQSVVRENLTQGNSVENQNPAKRYTGRRIRFDAGGYGRLEFRAMVKQIGHGAWPALWLFADEPSPAAGRGEIDVLEFFGFIQGDDRQIRRQSVTFGMATQTIHNWKNNHDWKNHDGQFRAIPISVGEWHTYRVEFGNNEARFYIDNCLRNRVKEDQMVHKLNIDNTITTTQFKLPKNQGYNIIISNPASSAAWLPLWYKAGTDASGTLGNGGSNFQPTEFLVDYVRFYTGHDIPVPLLPDRPGLALKRAPSGGPQFLFLRKSRPAR